MATAVIAVTLLGHNLYEALSVVAVTAVLSAELVGRLLSGPVVARVGGAAFGTAFAVELNRGPSTAAMGNV